MKLMKCHENGKTEMKTDEDDKNTGRMEIDTNKITM